MFLKKLSLVNFKNLEEAALSFSSRINCFVGGNGAGKTNVVDAVHYLSMCKSSLPMTDGQSVRHGSDFFLLDAEYADSRDRKEQIVCSFRRGTGKTIKRNGKEYDKISDHVGLIPVVIVSPSDSFLITDSAEERRRFLNSFLSQLDRGYLSAVMRYNRILAERNRLLKTSFASGGEVMEVLDMQLVEAGEAVHKGRDALVRRLAPLTARYYSALSGDSEAVSLEYRSELNETPFSRLLENSRERDACNQFTTCGIHRDELKMKIGGHPLRKYGSQGQQKSFLIALKLAQYSIVAEDKGEKPILLLDDLFDKLDTGRVEKLLELVSGEDFGQIFITDCNRERLEGILGRGTEDFAIFGVEEGRVSAL